MVFHKVWSLAHCYSIIYINDLPKSSKVLSFYLFPDDTNIYFESDNLAILTKKVNNELRKVKSWIDFNKRAVNIDKTNFFLPFQQKTVYRSASS